MIIKKRDSKSEDIKELKKLLQCKLPESKKLLIERELKSTASGEKGEKDSIYYIDFDYRDSKNYAVIHDLRLEHNGHVAQIDHLLIGRFLDFFVLETKNFANGIKITEDGEFLAYYNKKYYSIPSPVEQNNRHTSLLKKIIKDKKIMPTRLGLSIEPKFNSYVLFSTKSKVIRPAKKKLDTSSVIKADMLATIIERKYNNYSTLKATSTLTKLVSSNTIEEISNKLVELHKPIKIDYFNKFGITPKTLSAVSNKQGKYFCGNCKKNISKKVALFCFQNKSKFGGKAYCYDCQKIVQ
jgi:hypothetical protein